MQPICDVATVRRAEEALMAQLPDGALMQRAASGLASTCAELLGQVYGAQVVVLVGSGNNGGDALWAGAMLARRGAQVRALLAADAPHAEAFIAFRAAGGRMTEDVQCVRQADMVIDGLLGIGGKGALRGRVAEGARLAADATGIVVAVDVPSGVDADTGEVAVGAVVADVTVTFGCVKPGLLVMPGMTHVGQLVLVDIGLEITDDDSTWYTLDAFDVAQELPPERLDAHKYERGVIGVAAGSAAYPGAALLTAGAALRTGVGMVAFLDRRDGVADLVRATHPEVVTNCDRVTAWVVGPGFTGDVDDDPTIEFVLSSDLPVVIDAGALRALARSDALRALIRTRSAPTVLTPHEGEFTRLADALGIQSTDRIAQTQALAVALGAVVVRKGPGTIISGGFIDRMGGPELAVAGSGDVLSGIIGAMLATTDVTDPALTVAAAVFVHGLVGASAGVDPCSASDFVAWLPETIGELRALG